VVAGSKVLLGSDDTTGTITFIDPSPTQDGIRLENNVELRLTAGAGGEFDVAAVVRDKDGTHTTGAVVVDGSGVVGFTRAAGNAYSGGTVVSNGTLRVGNASGSATGHGPVSVAANGTLAGTGIVDPAAGNVVSVSGTVAPGACGIGTLSVGSAGSANNVSMAAGSTLAVDVAGDGTCDRLQIAGGLTLDASSVLAVSGSLNPDQVYTIATATEGVSGAFGASNLTGSWRVDYEATAVTLRCIRGTLVTLR